MSSQKFVLPPCIQLKPIKIIFLLLLSMRYIQQKFNEMSTLQSDFLFVAIHICNSSTFHDKCNSQLSVLFPQIQQKFNEMSTLQSDFLFVAIHIYNSSTFHDKLTLSCQYCSPRDERLRVSFCQVFIKFRVRCEFDFSFFPYLLFRMHEFKAPCMQKIIV